MASIPTLEPIGRETRKLNPDAWGGTFAITDEQRRWMERERDFHLAAAARFDAVLKAAGVVG